MPSLKYTTECYDCGRVLSHNAHECFHCVADFCYSCLIEHHHTTVRVELQSLVDQIDKILAPFQHHAHSQTEWTGHLTEDRSRLMDYIRSIDYTANYLPVLRLPSWSWIYHVENLICKESYAIYEICADLNRSDESFCKIMKKC